MISDIPSHVKDALRECSKDEASYQRLIELYGELQSQPQTQSPSKEQNYHELIATYSRDIIVLFNTNNELLYVTPSVTRLLGYTPEEILDQSITALIHPQDKPYVTRAVREFIQSGGHTEMRLEYRMQTADSHYVWIEAEFSAIYDSMQHIDKVVIAGRDLSARKQIEEERQRIDQNFQTLIDSLPLNFFMIDAQARLTLIDGRVSRELGLSSHQHVGMSILDLYRGNEQFLEDTGRVLDGNTIQRERIFGDRVYHTIYMPAYDQEGRVTGAMGMGIDITERWQAEAELRRQQLRYQALFDQTTDAVFITDLEGKIRDANQHACNLLGYSHDELIGMNYKSVSAPDQLPTNEDSFQHLLNGEYHPVVERVIVHRDGTRIPVEINGHLIRDPEGRPVQVQSLVRDISQRKENESILRENETRWRKVLEEMPVMVDAFDSDRKIIFWNRECERVTGYSQSEIIDNPDALKLLYPDAALREQMLKQVRERGIGYRGMEWALTRKDGSTCIINWSNVAYEAPIPGWGSWAVGIDVTEQRLAEEAQRKHEALLQQVTDHMHDMIIQTDLHGVLMYASSSHLRILGYAPHQLVGQVIYDLIHLDDHAAMKAAFSYVIANHQAITLEIRFVNAAGEIVPTETITVPIKDSSGRIRGMVVTSRDISIRKEMESAVREKHRVLGAFQKELELSQQKSRIMQTLNHEFRTPLAIILTTVEMLEKYNNRMTEQQRSERLWQVKHQIAHLTDMLNDIAFIARSESRREQFNPTPFDLTDLCRDVIHGLSLTVAADHRLEFTAPAEAMLINADPRLIRYVVVNLLSNAVKYSPEGSRVQIELLHESEYVCLVVHDEGIGIPPNDHQQVFEPFYRAQNIGNINGIGLGLSIVRDAVDMHNGMISFESQLEHGSSFYVRLPKAQQSLGQSDFDACTVN